MNRGSRELERLKAHLLTLSSAMPELMQRVRSRAEADGRADLGESLGDPEHERHRLTSFAAYLDQYGRLDARTLGPLDLRAVVEHAVAMTRGEVEAVARIQTVLGSVPLVRASERGLGQVFVSLLVNAAQAIAPGAPGANHVVIEVDTSDDGWGRVAIADSGAGIAPEHLPRIFEPMFSTKRGAGMGIGLAVVREIIEQLGGRISVESDPGFGTLFIIELPPVASNP